MDFPIHASGPLAWIGKSKPLGINYNFFRQNAEIKIRQNAELETIHYSSEISVKQENQKVIFPF